MTSRPVLSPAPNVTILPVIHGSGDCALAARRLMLAQSFDCVAVPLPPSFQLEVERAIDRLPLATVVLQSEETRFATQWQPERDEDGPDRGTCNFVPIDPCQPVIAALRTAMGERIAREFIDLETAQFEPVTAVLPDAYALKRVAHEKFAAAILPAIERPPEGQPRRRLRHMACQLRRLAQEYRSVLFVCSVLDWPWVREAYVERQSSDAAHELVSEPYACRVHEDSLAFMLGELPFITALYERARAELEDDDNLSVDGVKELLVAARDAYTRELGRRARRITPHTLKLLLKYIRNLSLSERRMTPDLYTMVTAAQQIAGDQFALHVVETAKQYTTDASDADLGVDLPEVRIGIDEARLPNGDVCNWVSRLPGPPVIWRSLQLQRRPQHDEREKWEYRWNPYGQCSHPPEDERIENFRSHLFDRARQIMGADLARTEKFTTSIMDGIDFRDTLRHWYEGDIYVKVLPPSMGNLDCAVMLFDSPADPREYPWRTTWYAEHENESTLVFYGTDFRKEMVGPGIGMSVYGGAMFLFPPTKIPEVWQDPRLDFTETMEERLLAAACLHSRCPQIALLSPLPPGAGWRRLAKRWKKTWVHVPLSQFSDATVQQLRIMHVLNGQEVRSYAHHFIRKI
ncbi:MAG: hypothetical protein KDB14_13200 [Planctomycetales bacterium]|nr:hypothetical protein [Planctomycetales bacterium]